MIRAIFILLVALTLYATSNTSTTVDDNVTAITQKNLYASFEPMPKRLFFSQYFDVTVKSLITAQSYKERHFAFDHGYGVKLLSKIPEHTQRGYYEYDTFTFQITRRAAKLPDFYLYLDYYDQNSSELKVLKTEPIDVITLPQKDGFSNIVAQQFEITDFHAKAYDDAHNIVVFSAEATHGDLGYFKLSQGIKEGFEMEKSSVQHAKMIYYVILDKQQDTLRFTYFNLPQNRYVPVSIPIVAQNDAVSTQENLTPKSNQHTLSKVIIAASFSTAFALFILYKRAYWWLLLLVFPISYIVYAMIPAQFVCIKANSALHILPMHNSTVSKRIAQRQELEMTATEGDFIKVIYQDTFGWVNHNDICAH